VSGDARGAGAAGGAGGGAGGGIDQPPPFWGRWSRLYWLVAVLLAADVAVSYLLTRWAS
jgi:hypothetical protein